MNIYFACSITGGREFEPVYQQIVGALLLEKHVIPTSYLAQTEVMERERLLSPQEVFERDINWIRNCDALIAEVSVPSHGVGYEVGFALNISKPVLCLYQQDRIVSKMITGNPHPGLSIEAYSVVEEAVVKSKDFLKSL